LPEGCDFGRAANGHTLRAESTQYGRICGHHFGSLYVTVQLRVGTTNVRGGARVEYW